MAYRKRVWDLMEDVEALNVKLIPRRKNIVIDVLGISTSALQPIERKKHKRFFMELVFAPSIPENIINLQVFQDDQHILEFIMCSGLFEDQTIDDNPKIE